MENDQLIKDIQARIREVDALDALFNEIDTEIYEDKDLNEWR